MQAFAMLAAGYIPELEHRLSSCITCEVHGVSAILGHVMSTKGKRIRPLLSIASALTTGSVPPSVMDVACAIELVHTASLVHDDVIDRSSERRGVVTINAKWGNHVAVLSGDILLSRALGMLTPYASHGAVEVVSQAISQMCESEIEQSQSAFDATSGEEAYFRRIGGKTAALLRAACLAGARVAGAPDDEARALGEFGYALGVAFQLSDDVLDFLGDPNDLGKPTCADLKSGVITLPALYLLADNVRGAYLREALETRTVARKMRRILKDLVETGALRKSIMRALDYILKAKEHLSQVSDGPGRDALQGALTLVANRTNLKFSESEVFSHLGLNRATALGQATASAEPLADPGH